jgi:hypothetical protein
MFVAHIAIPGVCSSHGLDHARQAVGGVPNLRIGAECIPVDVVDQEGSLFTNASS